MEDKLLGEPERRTEVPRLDGRNGDLGNYPLSGTSQGRRRRWGRLQQSEVYSPGGGDRETKRDNQREGWSNPSRKLPASIPSFPFLRLSR